MKPEYRRLSLLFILLFGSLSLAMANPVADQDIHITDRDTVCCNTIQTGDVITVDGVFGNDLIAACRSFSLHGSVMDNLIVACQMANIRGDVKGDILAFAQTVDVASDEVGDTRVFCQTFDIDNPVNGDVLAFAQTVRIGPNTVINGNVFIGAEKVYLEGLVLGSAKIMAEEIHFEGEIEGDLEVTFDSFDFSPRSKVLGNLTYWSEDFDATGLSDIVEGRVRIEEPVVVEEKSGIKGFVFVFLSALATAFLLIIFFKKRLAMILESGKKEFWKNSLIGLIGLVLIPIVFTLSILLVVTIPAGVILLAVYAIMVYLAWVTAAIFIGHMIFKWTKREDISLYIAAPVGVLLLALLTQIPILGGFTCTLATIIGFGLILTNIYDLFWAKKG